MTDLSWLNPVSADKLFAPLPPLRWLCRDLHIAPGAPTMVLGYGWSGKSVFIQTLMLCVASGIPFLGHAVRQGKVRHFDYEQGLRLTAERYQRIAHALGINLSSVGSNLEACILPDRGIDTLTDLRPLSEGFDLCSVDAWRGAHPTVDESSSTVRVTLDRMTRASESTGSVWLPLQHTGKPKADQAIDGRTAARGSSAFYDGSQTVILLDGREKYKPVMSLEKTRFGVLPPSVRLEVSDTDEGKGLRMAIVSGSPQDATKSPGRPRRNLTADVLALILKQPGLNREELRGKLQCGRSALVAELQSLSETRKIRNEKGGWIPYLIALENSNDT